MIFLSIIIPMYNVEPYVERCLRSIENQDIPKGDYEIICINDGSPDDCRGVVKQLQQEFTNIVLIDQENQGVSRARNNGINKATGKYILFIDPDDFVEANSFSRVLKIIEEKNAEVAFLEFSILNQEGLLSKYIPNLDNSGNVYPGIQAYFLSRGEGITDADRIWGVLFRKDFLVQNSLYYLPDVPYLEDGELIARILCLAERCIFIKNSFYLRTTRPGSATNSKLFNSEHAISGFIKAAINLRNFRDSMPLNKAQKDFINQPIVKFIALSISATAKLSKIKMFRQTYSTLKKNNFKKLNLNDCHKYYKKLGSLYNISGYLLYSYSTLRRLVLIFRNLTNRLLKTTP